MWLYQFTVFPLSGRWRWSSLESSHCRFLHLGEISSRFTRRKQAHFLVNRPHDRPDVRHLERKPKRSDDAACAGQDDGVWRSNPMSQGASQQAAEWRRAERRRVGSYGAAARARRGTRSQEERFLLCPN
jgi:hypothetical protein